MTRLDDVYRLLVDLSQDIGHIKGKVESIEEQVKKTNGRVTTLEEDTNATKIASEVSWSKIGMVGSVALFFFVAVFNVLIDYVKSRFLNN